MKPIIAIAVFDNGTVKFTEDLKNNRIKIDLNIIGLIPNSLHGFHVHEAGDLTGGIVIHADEDDCGKGGNSESLKTGNAGKRIACAVIGYSKHNF